MLNAEDYQFIFGLLGNLFIKDSVFRMSLMVNVIIITTQLCRNKLESAVLQILDS